MKDFLLKNNEIEEVFNSRDLEYDSPYSVDDLIKKAQELNKTDISINKSNSVAVIGNSGKLLKQNYGDLIDNHDYVIRCNLAVTDGYEKHVGSKTNIRLIAGKSFWRDLSEHFSGYDNNFLTNLIDEHFIIKAEPLYPAIQGVIKNFKTKSNILYLKQHLVDDIENNLNIAASEQGINPIFVHTWCLESSMFVINNT